jgi:hypothetical protein
MAGAEGLKKSPRRRGGAKSRIYFFFSFLGRFFSRFLGDPLPFISTSFE